MVHWEEVQVVVADPSLALTWKPVMIRWRRESGLLVEPESLAVEDFEQLGAYGFRILKYRTFVSGELSQLMLEFSVVHHFFPT
jgi:hypothetical protein